VPNTTHSNLDTLCQSKSKILFTDDDAIGEIESYFNENCKNTPSCKWDFDAMEPRPFRDLISDECKGRIANSVGGLDPITSNQFLMVAKCSGITYGIQGWMFHKLEIALICVIFDIVSIGIMIFVFIRLKTLNNEYIDIIDDNQITMKDFTVQINNLVLDKYTQDIRLVKMKIWLHFNNTFSTRKFMLKDNGFDVCDVTLSLSNQP
jgi:hypothetical protein